MTNTTRNSLIILIVGLLIGIGLFAFFRSVSTPPGQNATSTPNGTATSTTTGATSTTARTTGATNGGALSTKDQLAVQEALSSIDLKAMVDRATAQRKAGNYDAAIASLNQAIAVYPNHTLAYINLADIYTNYKRDYPKAELNLKKVIALDATALDAYRHLLEIYTTTSYQPTNTAAADITAKALVALPNAFELQVMLARYYRDTGRIADARAEYQLAIDNAKRLNNTTMAAQIQAEKDALPQ